MNVAVVALVLHDCILEVEDGHMKIDHRPLIQRVRVPERFTVLL